MRKWPRVVSHPRPRETGITLGHLVAIVLFVAACAKKIMELEQRFPRPRPERCPRCGSVRLWGHDFVPAYFDESLTAIWLRRFRCPVCRAVIRLRPWGYLSPFQAPEETIRQSLSNKLARGRGTHGLPRFSRRHWLKGSLRQVSL
ncbi:hypothetical protein DFAR_970013 [Desulfarculales bacterium]